MRPGTHRSARPVAMVRRGVVPCNLAAIPDR